MIIGSEIFGCGAFVSRFPFWGFVTFCGGNRPPVPLAINSVSVGLVKAALILYHGKIPPTAGFSSFPKSIDANAMKIRVPMTVEPLPQTESGRAPCTSINSYGFGGSNGYANQRGSVAFKSSFHFSPIIFEKMVYW